MVLPPYEGSSILESSWYFDHQVSSVFLFLLVLPLFALFAPFSLCVVAMRSLEYMFLQLLMMRNHQFENILLYHVLCKFYSPCLFGAPKIVKGATRHKVHSKRLKDRGGWYSRLWDVLMHLKKQGSQGRVHVASPKDEGKIFGLPKCIMRSRERGRAHGTLMKVQGWSFVPSGCTHALKDGAGRTLKGWSLGLHAFKAQ